MFVPLHGPASLPSQLQADLVVSQEAVLACIGTLQCGDVSVMGLYFYIGRVWRIFGNFKRILGEILPLGPGRQAE